MKTRWPQLLILTVCLALLGQSSPSDGRSDEAFVWWEGESPVDTNFPDRSWFAASTFASKRDDILSGGDWLSNSGDRNGPEAFAKYRVKVPASGSYELWARKFWKHGPFRWRFGDDDWRECGRDVGLADNVDIRTHLTVNWVSLGRVELKKGLRRFEIRLLAGPGEALTAAFDCFVLSAGPFLPRGRLKPGEPSGRVEEGWWALEPAPDPFGEAALDLRHLNEAEAGESGPVGRKGDGFVLGDGTPVRFFAVNCGPDIARLSETAVTYLARRLARQGVNMVRFHGPIFDRGSRDPAKVDHVLLAKIHYFVAAMKHEGIYTHLSFYFPLWFDVHPDYGIGGYESTAQKKPFSLLYFDPRMQEIWHAWAEKLLTTKNPHTGIPLSKDPAVAIVEIVNEDSPFFWTFKPGETIPAPQVEKMEKAFGAWLKRRYGSVAKALAAWGGAGRGRDDGREGRAELMPAWNMTTRGHGEGAVRRRTSDQVRFLSDHVRAFYADSTKYLKEDLGLIGLVSASNWKTADPRVLGPIEQHLYTATDVIDRHGYFGGRHEGQGSNYSVREGHTFADRAGVLEPAALPVQGAQVEGYPHIVTEIGWPSPNRFRAEFPFLAATHGAMSGLDGIFFFAIGGPGWDSAVKKFPINVPTVMGQFPGFALLYRRGDVTEAEPVFTESFAMDDLFDFRGGAIVTPLALDQMRKGEVEIRAEDPSPALDPLAFFVGRLVRKFDARKTAVRAADLKGSIDREKKVVTSASGEIRWDFGAGLVTVDTARAKGVTGFLGAAGKIEIAGVEIECRSEFGTILVISLDGRDLRESKRVLVQAMTEEKPFGFKTDGDRIADLGGFPMLVREIDAKVTIAGGARLRKAQALDPHGYDRAGVSVETKQRRRALEVRLPPDGMYVVLSEE